MELSVEMKKMVDVIKKYDYALRKGNDSWSHYFAPNIPDKKMKKLIDNFDNNLAINSVVAFYDTTLFSTSKGGLFLLMMGFTINT